MSVSEDNTTGNRAHTADRYILKNVRLETGFINDEAAPPACSGY